MSQGLSSVLSSNSQFLYEIRIVPISQMGKVRYTQRCEVT